MGLSARVLVPVCTRGKSLDLYHSWLLCGPGHGMLARRDTIPECVLGGVSVIVILGVASIQSFIVSTIQY